MDAFWERLHRFVELTERKRALEAEVKALQQEIAALEAEILPQWAEHGLSSLRVNEHTVYLQRELWASPVDEGRLCDALAEAGYGELVRRTVHRQQLSAWVREMEDQIPSTVLPWLKISETFRLRVRRTN